MEQRIYNDHGGNVAECYCGWHLIRETLANAIKSLADHRKKTGHLQKAEIF